MMTLDERLALFDQKKHGGKFMPSELVGKERFYAKGGESNSSNKKPAHIKRKKKK